MDQGWSLNFFVLFFRCFQLSIAHTFLKECFFFTSFPPSKFPVVKKKVIQRAFPIFFVWITTDDQPSEKEGSTLGVSSSRLLILSPRNPDPASVASEHGWVGWFSCSTLPEGGGPSGHLPRASAPPPSSRKTPGLLGNCSTALTPSTGTIYPSQDSKKKRGDPVMLGGLFSPFFFAKVIHSEAYPSFFSNWLVCEHLFQALSTTENINRSARTLARSDHSKARSANARDQN